MNTHTLSVLVEDTPGVLARVAALFSRRGFNIESLAVGATEQKDMSRMTIVVSAEETPLEQITKQLNKLINVIKIVELDDENSVSRELALIKVRADAGIRSQVIEAVNLFRAKVIDVSPEALGCVGLRCEREEDVEDVINQARAINDRPVVIDFIVGADAQVWPMVAAGTSNDEIQAARGIRPLFDDESEGHA